ncbi:response regulator transcription factor [Pseudonocardia sp. HH130629-09]|uniref:response regulator transcription factor n=1 Tax=Pseudonocardia sp. HH130629-09 TaxID=1641402 RepID=UPI0006CB51DB|nr:response regulator transcription factor [Pseudonocardia sp. HH130629-09]ALE86692.1 hypothetical protein XF36_28900 [Pseudonocardia sp. HH130629-09]
MARVLVAEDDTKQALVLREYLVREGYAVLVVGDGRAAIDAIRQRRPDLVLLDVMMPHLDGLDVLRSVRGEHPMAVMLITARSAEEDQLLGFDLGADDYVIKPYSPRQLMARVRAVLRRAGAGAAEAVLQFGELQIDLERCAVRVAGQPVELTAREFTLLETLAQRPGRVYSRRQLLEAIAGFDHLAMERTVDMHVSNIRRKMEPDPARPRYLLTMKGRGYRLAEDPTGAG